MTHRDPNQQNTMSIHDHLSSGRGRARPGRGGELVLTRGFLLIWATCFLVTVAISAWEYAGDEPQWVITVSWVAFPVSVLVNLYGLAEIVVSANSGCGHYEAIPHRLYRRSRHLINHRSTTGTSSARQEIQ
ncbi:hypothetical protein [Williamsia herbipolensis]|uniref:hypothetical protein n=1 Tax=Williamsia herbipolensis TaxID=1603258 RepID=UPI0005F7AFCB|nr:hypothetical protein [Williamsia herbipolensis]